MPTKSVLKLGSSLYNLYSTFGTKAKTDTGLRGKSFQVYARGEGSYAKYGSLLGVSRKMLKQHETEKEPKSKEPKLSEVDLAQLFFDKTATPLPDTKLVSKKTAKGAAVLQKSLSELHTDFCQSYGHNISFSTFAKCRPTNVKLMKQAKLRNAFASIVQT